MTESAFTDSIPQLSIELMEDGIGDGLVLLQQDDGNGTVDMVSLHPIHLRLMAEKMGLVKTSDPQTLKTIATLTRRLHTLRERCGHLAYWLNQLSDSEHADLSYEQVYAAATADMAQEFCADFDPVAGPSQSDGKCHSTAMPSPVSAADSAGGALPVVRQGHQQDGRIPEPANTPENGAAISAQRGTTDQLDLEQTT